METILSQHAGFCFGVKRAIEIIEKSVKENPDQPIYMLGNLVHNEHVVKKITDQGVILTNDINEIPDNSIVVFSAHGSPPSLYETAKNKNLVVIDSVCPFVSKAHHLGKLLAEEKYHTVVTGDKDHSEVKGIAGSIESVNDKVSIVSDIEDIYQQELDKKPRIGIVCQTTQDLTSFYKIVEEFLLTAPDVRIFNTICDATRHRQSSAIALASKVDLMIIVGSFTSANTKRLTKVCGEIVTTHQVETADDLDTDWFKNIKKVGVSAGASTPDWIIDKVMDELKKL